MGRAKMKMDLIKKEKARKIIYKKRKEGLIRKMNEFTTLCDVKAGLIMYDSTNKNPQLPDEVWPNNDEIKRLINLYQSSKDKESIGGSSSIRNYGLEDYFVDRNKKLEVELQKLDKEIVNNKYPNWFDFMNKLSQNQLREFANSVDSRNDFIKNRIKYLKTQKQQQIQMAQQQPPQPQILGLIHRGIELELTNQRWNSPETMATPVASAQIQVKYCPRSGGYLLEQEHRNQSAFMHNQPANQLAVMHDPGSGGYVLEQEHQNQLAGIHDPVSGGYVLEQEHQKQLAVIPVLEQEHQNQSAMMHDPDPESGGSGYVLEQYHQNQSAVMHDPGSSVGGGYVLEQEHQVNENPSMMMVLLNNGNDHQPLQYDGGSGSGSLPNYNIQRSLCYDSAAGRVVEEIVYNNPMPLMMSTPYPMSSYMQMQYPMVAGGVLPEMLTWQENQVDWPYDIYHQQFMPRNQW